MAQPEGPSGAMGFQPGARIWGGVARSELLKSQWTPVNTGAGSYGGGAAVAQVGRHTGIEIDAVGEWGSIEIEVPESYTALAYLVLRAIPLAGAAQVMNLRVDIDAANIREVFNTHTGGWVAGRNVTANQIDYFDLGGAIANALTGDDQVGIVATYQAAGPGAEIATDMLLLGALLEWL